MLSEPQDRGEKHPTPRTWRDSSLSLQKELDSINLTYSPSGDDTVTLIDVKIQDFAVTL